MSHSFYTRTVTSYHSGIYPQPPPGIPQPPSIPTATPSQPFLYLDLPPEIRTIILHHTLAHPSRIQQQPTPRKTTLGNAGLKFSTPLLCTNHQTRSEGLSILFSANILGIDLIPGDISLPSWIQSPGLHFPYLRNVDLHIFPRKCSRFTVNETTIRLVAQSLKSCENLQSVKITTFYNSSIQKLSSAGEIHSIAKGFSGIGAKMEIWLCDTSRNEGAEIWSSWNRARESLESAPMVKLARYHGPAGWVFEGEGVRDTKPRELYGYLYWGYGDGGFAG